MDSRGEENIFLFVPNLIGFARVILAIVSFYTMPIYPIITFVLYFLSAFLDAFDGLAARAFNQSTKFGALLDQLTDRVGTLCLMMTLGHFYPSYLFAFQVSAAVDISSHWMHGQVSLMSGKTSHKSIDLSGNSILRLYYQNKAVLFGMCFANEAFYVALYMLYFFEGPIVIAGLGLFRLLAYLCAPLALLKATISLIQLVAASINCKQIDILDRQKMK